MSFRVTLSIHLTLSSVLPVSISLFSKTVSPFSQSIQSLSHVQLFATPWTAACQASLSITNSRSSLRLTSTESVMPSSHLILCRPLLLLPPIPPSLRIFSNESTLHTRWPKYWSFSFSIIPSNEHPGLISFRMDWLDLLAVQGTLKSLLWHHSSKASILQHSVFFNETLAQFIYRTNILLFGSLYIILCYEKSKAFFEKSVQMVIAAMKLKDAYSLEENYDQPQ